MLAGTYQITQIYLPKIIMLIIVICVLWILLLSFPFLIHYKL